MTISSHESSVGAWSLMLFHRQDFSNNRLTRLPITPNQQGTMEMRCEVLSVVGAQDMDTVDNQMSDTELYWKDDQSNVDQ